MIQMSDVVLVAPAIFLGLFGWGFSEYVIRSDRRYKAQRAREATEQARTTLNP